MLISEEYRALNRELHERGVAYGVSGHRWAPAVDDIMHKSGYRSLLDYGCGAGTLRQALDAEEYRVDEYDPAIPGKDAEPNRADLVVCGDVLEHIEPALLNDVLDHIRDLAREGAFLVVSTVPAKKILADGRNAHLILESPTWWLDKIMLRWDLIKFEGSKKGFVAFVKVPG